MTLYHIHHTTVYQYTEPVSLCHNVLHLKPRFCARQVCQRDHLLISPEPVVMETHADYYGNPATFFTIQEPHRTLQVTADLMVEVSSEPLPNLAASPPWEMVRDGLTADKSPRGLEAYQFVFDSPYIPRSDDLATYATPSFTPGRPLAEAAMDLTKRIHRDFRYDQRATSLTTPVREVLAHRRGVCQDFAHLQIGCLRSLGLAARYVSGYLQTSPPPGQTKLVGADASHAWLAAFCPNLGWIDFDPTNDTIPGERHITLAWGRDYDDVSPIKGIILGGGQHSISVGVDVSSREKTN